MRSEQLSEIVRRTFNINNFESLTIEGYGYNSDINKAHLEAMKDCLTKAQNAMVRIFNIRKQHGLAQDYDPITYSIVTSELQAVDYELTNL